MPRKTRQRQNRSQSQERESTSSRASQRQSGRKVRRRVPSMPWFTSPSAQWTGIGAIGVAVIVVMVVFGMLQSGSGNSPFAMYQGEEVIGGSEMEFSQLFASEKPIVLNFWAGLCPPCRAEMPGFQAVYDQYQGEFILLGLDLGPFMNLGSNQDARTLLRELNITYPTGYSHNRSPVSQFGVIAMPTTLFFTPDGKVFRMRWTPKFGQVAKRESRS